MVKRETLPRGQGRKMKFPSTWGTARELEYEVGNEVPRPPCGRPNRECMKTPGLEWVEDPSLGAKDEDPSLERLGAKAENPSHVNDLKQCVFLTMFLQDFDI